jgi:chromate transport protein ChrA
LRITLAIPMMYIISRGNNTGRFMTSTLLGVLALLLGWVFLGAEPEIILLIIVAGLAGMLYKSKNDERYWS